MKLLEAVLLTGTETTAQKLILSYVLEIKQQKFFKWNKVLSV